MLARQELFCTAPQALDATLLWRCRPSLPVRWAEAASVPLVGRWFWKEEETYHG